MTDAPIFVVGLPRSGTTLLATMLSSHPRIDCGPETYFFRWLPKDPSPLLDERSWPDAATDFVCDLRPKSEPKVHELFGLTREQVREELGRREPSVAAMLESLTATHARVGGKARWAEKSPGHLTHLPLIRRTYPDAAFVRIVRDPRDTAMSMTRVHWASDSLVVDLYEVAMRDRRFDGPARRDPRLITVRFEDLVTDPEAVLRSICGFVGEKYSGEMLAPKERPATLGGDEEWWKQKAAERPDPSRVGAWQREMDPLDQRAAAVDLPRGPGAAPLSGRRRARSHGRHRAGRSGRLRSTPGAGRPRPRHRGHAGRARPAACRVPASATGVLGAPRR